MTLNNAINEFIFEQRVRGNSKKTIKYYNYCLSYFLVFVREDTGLNNITLFTLKSYYLYLTENNITSVTIQSYIRAVRAFFTFCYNNDYISKNLSDRFRLPKAKRQVIDILTDTEIKVLISSFKGDFIGPRNLCMILLMLDSGLRLNEVVTLKRHHIYLEECYIIVTGKGDKERYAPIGESTKNAFNCYLDYLTLPCEYVFVKEDFKPIQITTIKQLFRKLKVNLNIPRLRTHLLRHTFATRYLENGGDIYSLQIILGHTTLEMVKR